MSRGRSGNKLLDDYIGNVSDRCAPGEALRKGAELRLKRDLSSPKGSVETCNPRVQSILDAIILTPETKKVLEDATIDVLHYGKVTMSFERGKLTMINVSQNIKPGTTK